MAGDRGFDPFTPDALEDPYPHYARWRAADPVHWSPKLRAWTLFRHDDASAFFRDDARLSSDRRAGEHAAGAPPPAVRTVASDAPHCVPVRAMVTAALAPRVRALAPRVGALVDSLLDALDGAREADLVTAFAHPLPILVIAELLGVPADERASFAAASAQVARGMDRFRSGDEAAAGLGAIDALFRRLVVERRAAPRDDLVSRLLAAEHRGDRLSTDEVVAACTALVFGGHETTGNLLANGLLALLRAPEALARLRTEPSLLEPAVEELLRFDPPGQLIARTARTELALRGRTIRPGETVIALPGAANRDPEVFADPDRLDPARDPNPHLAFGLGTHFCPGAQLARLEARVALRGLLARFPRLALAGPPVRRPTAVLRGLERLPVRLV